MKSRILLCVLMCLTVAGIAVAQDTTWIDPTVAGALETTINADTAAGGVRAHPNAIYGLRKDGVYIQNAGIIFKGGTTLTIVGEKGGAYPVVQMQPVNGVDPGDLTNGIANKVEGSLHLDHVYWIGKVTDGTQYNQLFGMTTVNNLQQSCVVNDCVTEFIGIDTFNGDGWNHGSIWKFTNCYFRALFNAGQWWAARVMYCKKPIDTIWVENCTVSNGGLTFLQQEAVTRFAYFNHNTFINNHKYWLLNGYYQNLYIVNNFFSNQNWVGEDSVNVATGGQDPDGRTGHPMYMGTISVDTITIRQQVFADMINPDSTIDNTKVGLDKMHIYVSNNISWTDPLLDSYFKNEGNVWNSVGPYPLSYLTWASDPGGPWQIFNIPGVWMNPRTEGLFAAYPHNMAATHNTFTKIETKTPSLADASLIPLMGKWNQSQWNDPAWTATTLATDLVASVYVPGDKDATTLPGYTSGVKSENGDVGVAKVSDFIENYAQAGTAMNSTIDGLPIGALLWDDQNVPVSSFNEVMAAYATDVSTGVPVGPGLAESFKLDQNYPNPFNPSTLIEFNLPKASNVELKVFDMLGQEVATLIHGNLAVGQHSVTFNAKNLASGVYIYRLTAGSNVDVKKMVLMK
ncbi:MAG: T9SS type A sorting domain-containing protein [Bacteroidota bacterium]